MGLGLGMALGADARSLRHYRQMKLIRGLEELTTRRAKGERM
jgi:hypothetical protein